MIASQIDTGATLRRLDDRLARPGLTAREAERCRWLAESLRRPARVAILGHGENEAGWLMRAMAGADILPGIETGRVGDGPTIEVRHGTVARVTVTLEDGRTFTVEGPPGPEILRHDPVFLRIEAPLERLSRMSLLCLALGSHREDYMPALAWAGNRSEIAIWCTHAFTGTDAQIWAGAPETLKNHAYLVLTGPIDAATLRTARIVHGFNAAFAIPRSGNSDHARVQMAALRTRLAADIDEAHQADLDAAEVFLHRLGEAGARPVASRPVTPRSARSQPAPSHPASIPLEPALTQPSVPMFREPTEAAPAEATRRRVSEPLLYLRRRARALLEMLDWQHDGEDGADWPADVLAHCCETADALRDRALDWPEDDPTTQTLQSIIERACDTAILLQIESGPEQAQDAAVLMQQLRGAFEHALAA